LGSFRKEFLWEIVSSELVKLSWESFVRNCEYWIGSSAERVLWEIVSLKRERERFEMKCVLRGLSWRRMGS
jgi:alpha-amylase/alpha-mannosidase (GH57 family)